MTHIKHIFMCSMPHIHKMHMLKIKDMHICDIFINKEHIYMNFLCLEFLFIDSNFLKTFERLTALNFLKFLKRIS